MAGSCPGRDVLLQVVAALVRVPQTRSVRSDWPDASKHLPVFGQAKNATAVTHGPGVHQHEQGPAALDGVPDPDAAVVGARRHERFVAVLRRGIASWRPRRGLLV